MKVHLLLTSLVVLTTNLGLAQNDAAPKPDPFVKAKPGLPSVEAAPAAPKPVVAPEHTGIRFVFETYSMSLTEFDSLLSENLKNDALLERVHRLVAEDKATLDVVQSAVTKSGNRCALESTDGVMYATEFDPAPHGPAWPVAWEMKPCGDRLELDPVLLPDGKSVDMSFALESIRLIKWTEAKALPPVVGQINPLFNAAKTNTAVSLKIGEARFVGTLSGPAAPGVPEADDERVGLVFARATLELMPEKKTASPSPDTQQVRITFRTYALERADAGRLLRTHGGSDALHQEVQTMVKNGAAQLEHVSIGISKGGQRATAEEVAEFIHGTATARTPEAKDKSPAEAKAPAFSAFEMRPLGWRMEWDAVLSPDLSVLDVTLAPTHTEFRGSTAGHPLLEQLPQQPVFAERRINTSLGIAVGHTAFVSTLNRPRANGVNGRDDDGKTCLLFVEVVPW